MAAEDTHDEPAPPRRGRGRVLAVAGVLMAVAAIVLLVSGTGGDDGPGGGPLPEAGSRFRDEAGAARSIGSGDGQLPLERAVAQLFVAGFDNRAGPSRAWGGILVNDTNYVSPSQLRALVRGVGRSARRSRAPEPLVVGEPDLLGRLGPRAQSDVGVDGSPAEARATTRAAGRRLRAAGVQMVLAPSADLAAGGGPTELRAFGDDPLAVARLVRGAVDGWEDAGVLPVPGRFPGESGASQDPLEGPASVGFSLDELVARDVRPFAGVVARAPAMQMSAALYAAWDGVTPATLLPEAVALLRERLGFRGAVMSADLVAAQAATGEGIGRAAIDALVAGCDLLLVPGGKAEQEAAYRAVLDAARRGRLPRSRLQEALDRIRALKTAAR